MPVDVIDIADPDDPRVDDFRDLNSVDRRPDLPFSREDGPDAGSSSPRGCWWCSG